MTTIVDDFIAPACAEQIEILYHDEDVLLINKPSGLLSLSGKNLKNKDSVHFRLVQEYSSAVLLHRLDLGTSGIMLVALNKLTNAFLTKQFQARTITKTYVSLVQGHIKSDQGVIDYPIAKDPALFPRVKLCATGKPALTEYRVLERRSEPESTLVRYFPKTGRTHQLRIHSHYNQHPILGCDLYGNEKSYTAQSRLMLHAESLEFDHPSSGKRIHGLCPSPF